MSALDPGAVQRQAADGRASVWVAASAGTGKTKVLTDRVLALMLAGSEPSRILCLTFTKAAAAEMANRINERLSRWTTIGKGRLAQELQALTGELPDESMLDHARRLFARVLDAPGGMKIETIHAFCQSLLRRFPLEAGVPPHFELMDDRSAGEALAAAREEVLAAARAGDEPDLAAALAEVTRHVPEAGFGELLGSLALERARLRAAVADGHARFDTALRQLLDLSDGDTAESILTAACARGACDEEALQLAAEALSASAAKTDAERGEGIAEWLAAGSAIREAAFDGYLTLFFTQEGERRQRLLTAKLAQKNPGAAEALIAEAERLARIVPRRAAAGLAAATCALVRLGDALLAAYERYKAQRALLDFDDLVLKARDLLAQPGIAPWVLFKLDGGLDHILIDEAQDTNPDQWAVVAALAEEFFNGEGARAQTRTIFAVGDAKQSIYSFQRADPRAFFAMRTHFAERVAAAQAEWRNVDLAISFRSTEAVLAAVDGVFAQGTACDGVVLDGAPVRHTPFRVDEGGLVELWPPVEPLDAAPLAPWEAPVTQRQTREPRARLALAIAATLRRWLDTGERLAARDRPLRPGDVMVLVRRRGPFVAELVRALKQSDVPVAGVDRMLLTDQLAVQDMMALAQFLLLPDDDLTLATVLKGPLYGVDDALLFDLAYPRGERSLWSELRRRAQEHALFEKAATELGELLARADYMPPYELFAEVLGARGGRRQVLARLGPEAADPLDELLAAALSYERTHGPSLQGFLHWLAVGEAEVKRDLDQRGRDEVRILTVHGAKGLQAPVVFLPDTMQVPLQSPRLLWHEERLPLWLARRDMLPPAAATARAAALQRRDQEYRRLLYVALTRAEDRLYVCGWRSRQKAADDCWYGLVAAGLAGVDQAESFDFDTTPLLGAEGWTGKGRRLLSPQRAKPRAEEVLAAIEGTVMLPAWTGRPPPPEPSPSRPLAPSRPQESEPAVRSPLGGDAGLGFRRGRLIHRLLQSLPELLPEARAAAAQRFLARPVHGLTAAEQEAMLRETLAILDDPAFAPLFAPGSRAEVPVVGLFGGLALSGQIDRLVVTPDSVLIVDYKTLRPPPRTEAEVPAVYLEQLAAYRAAVGAIYPDRPVRCALLWTDGPSLMPVGADRLDRHVPAALGGLPAKAATP